MGIKLDIACGENKQEGFTGIDIRPLKGVDIVADLQVFPWPLKDNSVAMAIASHFFEHVEPKYSIQLMDEVWRVLEEGGSLSVAVPYPGSRGFWQDPTHCNGWNEVTWQYFDPDYPLYQIYKPKPWRIMKGFPAWQPNGNLEVVLYKRGVEVPALGISVNDGVAAKEVLHG